MKTGFKNLMLLMLVAFTAFSAQARRQERSGFNFGAGMQLMDASDRSFTRTGQTSEGEVTKNRNGFMPYIAIAVSDYFNLGLQGVMETEKTMDFERDTESGEQFRRVRNVSTQSMSFFSRFMFGNVLFLEAGLGIYQQKIASSNETTTDLGDGAFNGNRDEISQKGFGTGYNVAGGLEIPIDYGFYSTVSYGSRVFNIRDPDSPGRLGSRIGLFERRELVFGLSHYVQ